MDSYEPSGPLNIIVTKVVKKYEVI